MTAEQYIRENGSFLINQGLDHLEFTEVQLLMIGFAQLKSEEALKAAAKKSEIEVFIKGDYKGAKYRKLQDGEDYNPFETIQKYSINKKSILNAYSLTNIK